MSENKTTYSTGVSFHGLLAIVFITLKLCKVIDWPWIWVLAPLWISLSIGIFFLGIAGVLFLIVRWCDKNIKK